MKLILAYDTVTKQIVWMDLTDCSTTVPGENGTPTLGDPAEVTKVAEALQALCTQFSST